MKEVITIDQFCRELVQALQDKRPDVIGELATRFKKSRKYVSNRIAQLRKCGFNLPEMK